MKSVLEAETIEELEETIQTAIDSLEERDKTYIKLPKRNGKSKDTPVWRLPSSLCRHFFTPYTFCFRPAEARGNYGKQPLFLNQQYSKVIDTLAKYDAESLPESVQYELASSYVAVENLREEQRKTSGIW